MKSWRPVIVLLIPLIIVGSVACELSTEDEEASQQVEVVRGDFIVSVSGGGRLELTDEAHLTFGIAGRLDKIFVEDGSAVSRGEVLARLETDSLELESQPDSWQ